MLLVIHFTASKMVLINKKSRIIRQHKKFARFSPFIRFSRKYIFFPLSSVELCEAHTGKYFHFVDLGKETGFIINNDENGYVLQNNTSRDATVRVSSVAMISWFCDKHKIDLKTSISFYIVKGDIEFQGQTMYEIMTDKPRDENGDD